MTTNHSTITLYMDRIENYTNKSDTFYNEIIFTGTFRKPGFYFIALPFDVSVSQLMTDFTLHSIIEGSGFDDNNGDGQPDKLKLKIIEYKNPGRMIPHHSPILLKPKTTGIKKITVNDSILYAACDIKLKYSFINIYIDYKFKPVGTLNPTIHKIFNGDDTYIDAPNEVITPFACYIEHAQGVPRGNFIGEFDDTTSKSDWFCYVNGEKIMFDTAMFNQQYISDKPITSISFAGSSIKEINGLPDTSQVKSFDGMFKNCQHLVYFDLWQNEGNKLNTDSATSMSELFYGCTKLHNASEPFTNLSNVTDYSRMFYGCSEYFMTDDTSMNELHVTPDTNIKQMFCGCTFQTIDLSNWKIDPNCDPAYDSKYQNVFNEIPNLRTIYLSSYDLEDAWRKILAASGQTNTSIHVR